jgi:ComF family protein
MWLKNILYLLIPARCLLCDMAAQGHRDLCGYCASALTPLPLGCRCCALPLATVGDLCPDCISKPPSFDRIRAAFIYHAPCSILISQFKFNQNLAAGALLTELFVEQLQPLEFVPELLLPLPLSQQRLSQRGFNQALEIAKVLAQQLQLPLDWQLLTKTKDTSAQSSLSRQQRLQNLQQVFHLTQPLKAKRIALIDDVVTTGATAEAASQVLKAAGAEYIEVWALARTLKTSP